MWPVTVTAEWCERPFRSTVQEASLAHLTAFGNSLPLFGVIGSVSCVYTGTRALSVSLSGDYAIKAFVVHSLKLIIFVWHSKKAADRATNPFLYLNDNQ